MCLNFFSLVEAQRVLVTDGSFHSDICVSPLRTSPAPFFTGILENNMTFEFNKAELNEFYSSNIYRNFTSEGHHQALLIIDGVNHTFSNAIITCWVNSDVILQYRLIIGNSPSFMIIIYDYLNHSILTKLFKLHCMIFILCIKFYHCRVEHRSYYGR